MRAGPTGGLAVVAVIVGSLSRAVAQPLPEEPRPVEQPAGTKIPVTMPGSTEVLGAESAAATSRAAPIALEQPIDPDHYICGPGDVFELNFWGKQNFRLSISADLEGRAFISKIGYVPVAGKTLTAVRDLVKKKVRHSYPGLRFDLTLTRPRSFVVHVADNVKKPGAQVARPIDRVSAVLDRAGGVTGSRRRIAIKHTDGSEASADLLLYDLTGDTKYDPRVLDGDVITVPFADDDVSISGAVRRPGTYELVDTKDLAELLELAGGFKSSVDRHMPIKLARRDKHQHETFYDLRFSESGQPPNHGLRDDDTIIVRDVAELQRSVTLIGAVVGAETVDQATTAKRLPYIAGDTVRTLIDRAGGIKAPGDLERAYISRPRKGKRPELIPIDLEALLVRRDFSADKKIYMGDTIVVPPMRHGVLVEGAVARAGLYNFNPRFGIREYIAHAGGRTRLARDESKVKLIEPDGSTRPFRHDTKPGPGDTILVPERNFSRAEVVQIGVSIVGLVLSGVAITLAATR